MTVTRTCKECGVDFEQSDDEPEDDFCSEECEDDAEGGDDEDDDAEA